ncbi:MAG: hypothetical protein ABDH49_09180, partial [Candidatus Hydrothermales bacterium]
IKGEDDIDKLRKEEAEIFGGTERGEERSKVRIRIEKERSDIGDNIKSEIDSFKGLEYLYYSTFLLKLRQYFKPDVTQFLLNLSSHTQQAFLNGAASLWLAIYLGGFGTRARRGGGNIEVLEFQGEKINEIKFICHANDKRELKEFIKHNMDIVKNICQQGSGTQKYSILRGSKILIFESKNNWKEALNFLGENYKKFREDKKNLVFETAAFGMPVMHSGSKVRIVPYRREDSGDSRLSDRWASPLIFKIIKANNLYFPVIVKLSGGGVDFV